MKLFAERQNCCGCTACVQTCPRGAISLSTDSEGFAYPVVDERQCVDCGLCREVCAFQRDQRGKNSPEKNSAADPLKILAVKHRNVAIRSESQSGGLFTLLSDPILERGGVIYGAGFRADFSVTHQRAETRAARDLLRGSKYVQSDLGNVFQNVRDDLRQGREVLFSGTPCQVAGLRSFLMMSKSDMRRLLLCDLVCHGTPSPMVWRDYLAWCEKRAGQKITSACFRDSRRFGWHSHVETLVFENGKIHSDKIYTTLFYQRLMHRPSCHACPYATPRRASDVTMGDFWGIERSHPDFADNIGISLALVHSEKGMQAMAAAAERMEIVESKVDECSQPTLCEAVKPSKRRNLFWQDYKKNKIDFVIIKFGILFLEINKFKTLMSRILKGPR